MNVFDVMLRGWIHCISNASSIFFFNILYVFAFVKIMYFECQNKQFEGKKTGLATGFSSGRQVCKTSIPKTMA